MITLNNKHYPLKTIGAAAVLVVGGIVLTFLGGFDVAKSEDSAVAMLTVGIIAFVAGIGTGIYAKKLAKRSIQIYAVEMASHKQQLERTAIPYQRRFRKLYNSESQHLNYHRHHRNNPFKVKKLHVRDNLQAQDRMKLRSILSQWLQSSSDYVNNCKTEAFRRGIDQVVMHKEFSILDSANRVIYSIHKELPYSAESTVLVALDENNRVQAVCVAKIDKGARWKIEYLATAPHNIRSDIFPMDDAIRVEGAPGALIDRVIRLSYLTKRETAPKKGESRAEFLENNRTSITLRYSTTAKSYYTDRYFQTDEVTNQRNQQNDNLILRGEHLRRYLNEFGGRASIL